MKFFFIRHGETRLNKEGRIRGWSDVPLDESGRKAAASVAEKIKDEGIDAIYTSDLVRAQETAEIISEVTGAPILDVLEGLRPWNVGEYTGEKGEIVGPIMQKLIEEKPDEPSPGGESFTDFRDRYLTCVSSLLEKHKNENFAIVAHHRNERLLYSWAKLGQTGDFQIDPKDMKIEGLVPGSALEYQLVDGRLGEEEVPTVGEDFEKGIKELVLFTTATRRFLMKSIEDLTQEDVDALSTGID